MLQKIAHGTGPSGFCCKHAYSCLSGLRNRLPALAGPWAVLFHADGLTWDNEGKGSKRPCSVPWVALSSPEKLLLIPIRLSSKGNTRCVRGRLLRGHVMC